MDRRKFLMGAAAAAALPAVAPLVPAIPELAVAMPPAPSITGTSLMMTSNNFLTAEVVAKETLRILRVELRRAYALSPDEMNTEIAQMELADRAYVMGGDA